MTRPVPDPTESRRTPAAGLTVIVTDCLSGEPAHTGRVGVVIGDCIPGRVHVGFAHPDVPYCCAQVEACDPQPELEASDHEWHAEAMQERTDK